MITRVFRQKFFADLTSRQANRYLTLEVLKNLYKEDNKCKLL